MSTLRTTLLDHQPEPNGGQEPHFDWLLETVRADPTQREVPTWRVGTRIDRMAPGTEAALQRIGLHRGAWLDLAEPQELSRGRGKVLPCAQGRILEIDFSKNDVWTVSILWNDDTQGHYSIQGPHLDDGSVKRVPTPTWSRIRSYTMWKLMQALFFQHFIAKSHHETDSSK